MMRRFRNSAAVTALYWVFVVACIAVAIVVLRQHLPRYLPMDWVNAHEGDALADWRAARLYPLDISPYTKLGLEMVVAPMGHPPSTVFWYLPMVDFSKPLAAELSSLALWFLIIPHIYMCAKVLKWPAPMAWTALLTALAFSTSWFQYHFSVIQFSEVIAFLYVVGWVFLRSGRDTLAGVCIGLAATIKFFPGIMIVMLLVSRRWRAFFAASATFLTIAAIMTQAFGLESWSQYAALQKPIAETWYGAMQNSSLSGLLNQIRSPFCGGGVVDALHSATPTLASVGGAVLFISAIWASQSHLKRARDTQGDRIDLPFALFSVLSVFLNPWVWEHYYVLAIQPLFVVTTEFSRLAQLAYRRWSDRETSNLRFALQTAGAALVLLALSLVACAFNRNVWVPWWYIEAWKSTGEPLYHVVAHVDLALKVVPWVVPMILCFSALRVSRKFGI
jgi:hypothetical protein